MKKTGILIVILTIIGMVLFLKQLKVNDTNNQVIKEDKKEIKDPKKYLQKKKKFEEGKVTFFTKEYQRKDNTFSQDKEKEEFIIKPKEKVKPLYYFSYKIGDVKKLKKGDTFVLPEIEDIEYEIEISNVTKNSNGSITVQGSIDNSDDSYYAIITEGNNTLLMTISTENGTFSVEGKKGEGYIYREGDINRAYIDYKKSDMKQFKKKENE